MVRLFTSNDRRLNGALAVCHSRHTDQIKSNELKKELALPKYSRIKTKLEHSLGEIRNLMEELHEFDTMIRDIDSMILRGYFYTCLDRLTEKCRSFEEDIRWAMAERASTFTSYTSAVWR